MQLLFAMPLIRLVLAFALLWLLCVLAYLGAIACFMCLRMCMQSICCLCLASYHMCLRWICRMICHHEFQHCICKKCGAEVHQWEITVTYPGPILSPNVGGPGPDDWNSFEVTG